MTSVESFDGVWISEPPTGAQPLDWLTLVGLILTIVAFLLAIFQVLQAKRQSDGLKTHEGSLRSIAGSLSTRYLGPFPEYMETAIGVIGRAKSDILIVNANPTPAYFSFPLKWIEYRHAIAQRMHSGVTVTLISVTPNVRFKRMQDQFLMDAGEWPTWRGRNEARISTFLAQQYPDEAERNLEFHRFLEMLVETQTKLCIELFRPATRIEIDSTVPLQVWISDKNEAVFTIETTAKNALSHGLYTSDPKFVAALYAMAELYRSAWTTSPGPPAVLPTIERNEIGDQ